MTHAASAAIPPPLAASNATATALDAHHIKVTWTDNSNPPNVEEDAFACDVRRPADTLVVRDIGALRSLRPAKLVVWHPRRDPVSFESWVRRRVARHVSVTRSDAEFVELSARGVDKGHAVRLFARP